MSKNHSSKDISIIIVNYNVKEYLANLLQSINKAKRELDLEIIVIDNASSDGSIEYLKPRYPNVHFIENEYNAGFGKANNQGIKIVKGKYTLLINPDTLISEDTLTVMFNHMEVHSQTGAAGCKMLNPDGSFAPESRRSIPTPFTSLWKVLGLNKIFSSSRTFNNYYLGWMDENEAGQVPVLSGAFMFFRTRLLKELTGFDERFFMYGEDIDLCYRVGKTGYVIDYVPVTSIIHYKGESTKKENLDYVITFNKAMYLFFEKHYSYAYTFFIRIFVLMGIIIRGITSYISTLFKRTQDVIVDLGIINLILGVLFMFRYEMSFGNIFSEYKLGYLFVHALVCVLFISLSKYYDLYGKNKDSIASVIKTVIITFAGVALITFFLRDFAFSRLVLFTGLFLSIASLALIRFISKNQIHSNRLHLGKIKPIRLMLVGVDDKTVDLIRKIRSKVAWNYEIVGIIAQNDQDWVDEIEKVSIVGKVKHIADLARFQKVDQLIFSAGSISNKEILNMMSQLQNQRVVCKVAPDSLDYIIGKSNIEYLTDIPVVDVELPYGTAWNQFLKRNLDFWLSLIIVVLGAPFYFVAKIVKLFQGKSKSKIWYLVSKNKKECINLYLPFEENSWLNRYLLITHICRGRLSFVGAPLVAERKNIPVYYKPGLTGLRQINEKRVFREEEKEKYEMYYVQNYSIAMDLHVLFNTIFGKGVSVPISGKA
ncbi:MAG: glycosyltransferase [Balneolales bacterium]